MAAETIHAGVRLFSLSDKSKMVMHLFMYRWIFIRIAIMTPTPCAWHHGNVNFMVQKSKPATASPIPPVFKAVALAVLFAAGLWGADRASAWGLQGVFYRAVSDSAGGGKLNQAVLARADAYVLGDSRAQYHYDPEILTDMTGLRFFNAGLEGREILYLRLQADLIEQAHKPKLYLVEISFHNFDNRRPHTYDSMLYLSMPFYHRSPVVAEYLSHGSSELKSKLRLCASYSYNGKMLNIVNHALGVPPASENGFAYRTDHLKPEVSRFLLNGNLEKFVIDEFLVFVQQARQKQITVVFCMGQIRIVSSRLGKHYKGLDFDRCHNCRVRPRALEVDEQPILLVEKRLQQKIVDIAFCAAQVFSLFQGLEHL
jgi:hypothetical protein